MQKPATLAPDLAADPTCNSTQIISWSFVGSLFWMPRKSAKRSKAGLEPVVTVFMGVQWLLHRILRLIYEKIKPCGHVEPCCSQQLFMPPAKVFFKDKRWVIPMFRKRAMYCNGSHHGSKLVASGNHRLAYQLIDRWFWNILNKQ